MYKVVVAGIGIIGKPVGEYVLSRGHKVFGYDVKHVNASFPVYTNWDEIPHDEIDVYIISVWTGIRGTEPDMSAVEDVARKIFKSNPSALVTIESTVVPGTCRFIAKKYGLKVAHCPHRYWAVDPIHYGVRQWRVLGAVDEETLQLAINFYQDLDIPVFVVSKVEVAELAKIVENAYRYVQIAFAEQAKLIADKIGVNFWELRQAVNTKFNIEMPEARRGIGGHCLPKDTRYLLNLARKLGVPTDIIVGALKIDEEYKKYIKGK